MVYKISNSPPRVSEACHANTFIIGLGPLDKVLDASPCSGAKGVAGRILHSQPPVRKLDVCDLRHGLPIALEYLFGPFCVGKLLDEFGIAG